jgi:hypothetical protein
VTVVFEGRSMTHVYQEIRMNALIEKAFEYSVPNPLLAPLDKLVLRYPLPAKRAQALKR